MDDKKIKISFQMSDDTTIDTNTIVIPRGMSIMRYAGTLSVSATSLNKKSLSGEAANFTTLYIGEQIIDNLGNLFVVQKTTQSDTIEIAYKYSIKGEDGDPATVSVTGSNGIIVTSTSSESGSEYKVEHTNTGKKLDTLGLYKIKVDDQGHIIESAVASPSDLGLSSAMRYAGNTTTNLVDGSNITTIIIDGNDYTASKGDVVIKNSTDKEFLFNGTTWDELGDPSSHALKSIEISAGEGLEGGGTLEENRTIRHYIPMNLDLEDRKYNNKDDTSDKGISGKFISMLTLDKFGHVMRAGIANALPMDDVGCVTKDVILHTESSKNGNKIVSRSTLGTATNDDMTLRVMQESWEDLSTEYSFLDMRFEAEKSTGGPSGTRYGYKFGYLGISPNTDAKHDLGASDHRFKDLYLSGKLNKLTIPDSESTLATEQWVVDKDYATRSEIPSIEIPEKLPNPNALTFGTKSYDGSSTQELLIGDLVSNATQSESGLMSSTDKKKLDGLAAVATSGNYNDLTNKPTIPTIPTNYVTTNTNQTITGSKILDLTPSGNVTKSFDIINNGNVSVFRVESSTNGVAKVLIDDGCDGDVSLYFSGNCGIAGEVLTSQGQDATPTWASLPCKSVYTSTISIWGLDPGIYVLHNNPSNGDGINIRYMGGDDTMYFKAGNAGCNVTLIITSTTNPALTLNWYLFDNSTIIWYGFTTADDGDYSSKNLSQLGTGISSISVVSA